jgi:uncharacterized membrane-anchored protein YitT (DUF2179 family)
MNKASLLDEIKSYVFIFLGIALYTFSVSAFTIPHKIVGGGATGMATIIYYLTDEKVPVWGSFLLINAILLGFGLKVLGPKFGIKSIFGILMCTLLLGVWKPIIPHALVSDMFMSAVIAGIMNGVGIAIAISNGGSTGGTDIIALVVNKYRNVSPGKVLMYVDGLIILGTLMINFNLEGLMYGYVLMGISTFSIDFVLSGKKQSAQLLIFTDHYEQVAEDITHVYNRGVTVVDCVGWYTKQPKKMLVVVVRKTEALEVLKIAKRIDPNVFMTMNTVMGVFGKGFEDIKGIKKAK